MLLLGDRGLLDAALERDVLGGLSNAVAAASRARCFIVRTSLVVARLLERALMRMKLRSLF